MSVLSIADFVQASQHDWRENRWRLTLAHAVRLCSVVAAERLLTSPPRDVSSAVGSALTMTEPDSVLVACCDLQERFLSHSFLYWWGRELLDSI